MHKSLSSPPIAFPKRIIYATDLSDPKDENKDKHEQFLTAVEAFLGVKSKKISVAKTWAAKPPSDAKSLGLQEYMKDVSQQTTGFKLTKAYLLLIGAILIVLL